MYSVHRLAVQISDPYSDDMDDLLPRVVEQSERGAIPEASPFVRRMPDNQARVEEKRAQRQGRHVAAYEIHVVGSMQHFQQACSAMIDGALAGDLDMIDDEFPKLADIAAEARRAYEIWATING